MQAPKLILSFFVLITFLSSNFSLAIIGGKIVNENEVSFPASVMLHFSRYNFSGVDKCAATKVGPRLFITARHCLQTDVLTRGRVALFNKTNTKNILKDFDNIIVKAEIIALHTFPPTLKRFDELTREERKPMGKSQLILATEFPDIMFFELDRDSPTIPIANVDLQWKPRTSEKVVISGWGRVADGFSGREFDQDYMPGDLKYSLVEIQQSTQKHFFATKGSRFGHMARTAQGDSGQGVFLPSSDQVYNTLVGVNSFGVEKDKITGEIYWSAFARFDFDENQEHLSWLDNVIHKNATQAGRKTIATIKTTKGPIIKIKEPLFNNGGANFKTQSKLCFSIDNWEDGKNLRFDDLEKFKEIFGNKSKGTNLEEDLSSRNIIISYNQIKGKITKISNKYILLKDDKDIDSVANLLSRNRIHQLLYMEYLDESETKKRETLRTCLYK